MKECLTIIYKQDREYLEENGFANIAPKKLVITFDDEATAIDIIKEMLDLMQYMSYSSIKDKKYLMEILDKLEKQSVIQ